MNQWDQKVNQWDLKNEPMGPKKKTKSKSEPVGPKKKIFIKNTSQGHRVMPFGSPNVSGASFHMPQFATFSRSGRWAPSFDPFPRSRSMVEISWFFLEVKRSWESCYKSFRSLPCHYKQLWFFKGGVSRSWFWDLEFWKLRPCCTSWEGDTTLSGVWEYLAMCPL